MQTRGVGRLVPAGVKWIYGGGRGEYTWIFCLARCFCFIAFAIGKLRNKVSPKNPDKLAEEEEEEKEEEEEEKRAVVGILARGREYFRDNVQFLLFVI